MSRTYIQIEKEADEFLKTFHPSLSIPIPIEDIVEYGLGLTVVPHKGLFSKESIDAFLSSDLTELHIDEDHYTDQTTRGRFTIAHEIGHFIMHREFITVATSIDNWKQIILGEGSGRDYLETEADSFAGCLLMPRKPLLEEFQTQKEKMEQFFSKTKMAMPSDEQMIPYVANKIGLKFEVSSLAAQYRLERVFKNRK